MTTTPVMLTAEHARKAFGLLVAASEAAKAANAYVQEYGPGLYLWAESVTEEEGGKALGISGAKFGYVRHFFWFFSDALTGHDREDANEVFSLCVQAHTLGARCSWKEWKEDRGAYTTTTQAVNAFRAKVGKGNRAEKKGVTVAALEAAKKEKAEEREATKAAAEQNKSDAEVIAPMVIASRRLKGDGTVDQDLLKEMILNLVPLLQVGREDIVAMLTVQVPATV